MINRESETSDLNADLEDQLVQVKANQTTNQDQTRPDQTPQDIKADKPKERLMSLDVYRGLTVFGMILADQTYDIEGAVWWLIHPKWNGFTCADLVFPAFLFIMGVAIPLAVSKGRPIQTKNVVRVFALFAIGLALNIIEDFDFPNRTPLLI